MNACGPAAAANARLVAVIGTAVLPAVFLFGPRADAASPGAGRLVVVLYPTDNDGSPGNREADHGIRSTFASGAGESVEVENEYLDVTRFPDPGYQGHLAEFLRQKYAARKVDLVIAGLSSSLDFAVKYRETAFPGVPIVFCAVDDDELKARRLPPDVVGVPIQMELMGTLDMALKLHPNTRRVFVVAGASKFDTDWEAEARLEFRRFEGKVEFTYLGGLPMPDLLERVSHLPDGSIVYYLHIFQDGAGKIVIPAEGLEQLAACSNAPIYGHVDTYIGRGAVGGRVFSFESAGEDSAKLGLRILAGEQPETMSIPPQADTTPVFDARQLRRWNVSRDRLPPGSVVNFEEPSLWDQYKWHIIGVTSLCVVEALLIVGLLVQRRASAAGGDALPADAGRGAQRHAHGGTRREHPSGQRADGKALRLPEGGAARPSRGHARAGTVPRRARRPPRPLLRRAGSPRHGGGARPVRGAQGRDRVPCRDRPQPGPNRERAVHPRVHHRRHGSPACRGRLEEESA